MARFLAVCRVSQAMLTERYKEFMYRMGPMPMDLTPPANRIALGGRAGSLPPTDDVAWYI